LEFTMSQPSKHWYNIHKSLHLAHSF
jgi:hypothetical protein